MSTTLKHSMAILIVALAVLAGVFSVVVQAPVSYAANTLGAVATHTALSQEEDEVDVDASTDMTEEIVAEADEDEVVSTLSQEATDDDDFAEEATEEFAVILPEDELEPGEEIGWAAYEEPTLEEEDLSSQEEVLAEDEDVASDEEEMPRIIPDLEDPAVEEEADLLV